MKLKDKIILGMLFILLIAFVLVYTLYKNTRVVKANNTTTTTTTEVITTTSTTSTTTTTTKKTKKTTKKVVRKTTRYHITGYTETSIKNYLHEMVLAYGWTEEDYVKALYIMTHESMNPNSRINSYDAPCGLAQANPCSKVPEQYRKDWKYQVRWFLDYIKNRYKTVDSAYKYKRKHGKY